MHATTRQLAQAWLDLKGRTATQADYAARNRTWLTPRQCSGQPHNLVVGEQRRGAVVSAR